MVKLFPVVCLVIFLQGFNNASDSNVETDQDTGNSNASSADSDYIYEYNTPEGFRITSYVLNNVGLIIIVILALFGNTVIIIILTKKKNRSFPTSIFLTSLAISDIISVISSPLLDWLSAVNDRFYIFPIEITCKLILTLTQTSSMSSSWSLAAIAIERVISVAVPHKVKIICSSLTAKRAVVGIWMAFIGVSIFLAIVRKPYGKYDCVFIDEYANFYIFDLSVTILVFMIPFVIIFTATVVIIVQLFRRKQKSVSSKSLNVWPITFTLMLTNIAFIATVMPINVVFMVYKIQGFLGGEQISNIYFWMNTFRFLLYLNSCLNFFIYFLSGSRFRAEVKDLFSFRRKLPSSQHTHIVPISAEHRNIGKVCR